MGSETVPGESFPQWCGRLFFDYATADTATHDYYRRHRGNLKRVMEQKTALFLAGSFISQQRSFSLFLNDALSAAAKDIMWWRVKERTPQTDWEQLAVDLDLQDHAELLIKSIPDWCRHARLRKADTAFNRFCHEGAIKIIKAMDWEKLARDLA